MQKKTILALGILAAGIATQLTVQAAQPEGRAYRGRTASAVFTDFPLADAPKISTEFAATSSPTVEMISTIPGEAALAEPETARYEAPGMADDYADGFAEDFEGGLSGYVGEKSPAGGSLLEDGFDFGGGYDYYDEDAYPAPYPDDSGGGYYDDDAYPAPDPDGSGGGYYDDDAYPAPPSETPEAEPTELPSPAPTATEEPAAPQPTLEPTATHTPIPPAPTATAPLPTAQPTPTPTAAPTPEALISAFAAEAPALDGSAGDAAWQAAAELAIETTGGANDSAAQVFIRSLYDDEYIYFLLTWEDPTRSVLREPWEKQPDGAWKVLTAEDVYAEDQLALLWAARNFSAFTAQGCGSACHAGEDPQAKPSISMYAPEENDLGDIWQWRAARGVGQVYDGYLDGAPYSPSSPAAGFHPDPGEGGDRPNRSEGGSAPESMPPGGGTKDGLPGYILAGEGVPFDDAIFSARDRVPGVIASEFSGDRGDIQAAWGYQDGRWTLELRRKLVTGSPFDVQFDDLDAEYAFGLATFDNSQLQHAVQDSATPFVFER